MLNIWTKDIKCAVVFSFDLDAETFWFSRNERSYSSPSLLAEGSYGPNIGMPRILNILDEMNIKATFFIPGWVIEKHTKIVKEIVKRGHEIGYHGYLHERVYLLEEEKKRIVKCKEIMKKYINVEPVGYRAPEADLVPEVLKLIKENGFQYSSNFMDADSPYLHEFKNDDPLVELPTSWLFDDSSHFFFTLQEPARRPIASHNTVLEIWKSEFDGIYEEGGSIVFMLHPQIIGRVSRVKMLKELIGYIQERPNVFIGTGKEVAKIYLENLMK
jgi:peptidoglycan-N-acetylglucosamine deacetylase